MHPILNIAIRAARIAGSLVAKYYDTTRIIRVSNKGTDTFITNVSREIEHLIVKIIRKSYPQHSILMKKNHEMIVANNDIQWIIDPLNGMNNFIKCFPHFSVSIAVRVKGYTEVAVVYDPIRNELFTASRGQGAQLNGYRLRGSTIRDLENSILATGFPFKHKKTVNNYIAVINELFVQCEDFRHTGSTALDLAYVAAGRIDGFFEIGLKVCEFAGSELLVREAGSLVTDFVGSHNYIFSGNIVAGNSYVVQAILSIIHHELNNRC